MAKAATSELRKVEATPLAITAEVDLADDAGAGFEDAGPEAFAIPFLTVIQKTSPQVDETAAEYLPDARPGMIYETVSGRLFDGKKGVDLLLAHYRSVFICWGPRDSGGGFKGEYLREDVAMMRRDRKIVDLDGRLYMPLEDGSVNEKKSDRFAEVMNHYCLLIDREAGTAAQILLSLTSTQIKKSKALMAQLDGLRVATKDGQRKRPALWKSIVHMTTTPESNDKGSWYGVKFELTGNINSLPEPAAFDAAARAFHEIVRAGSVVSRYDPVAAGGGGSASEDEGRF